MKRFGFVRSKTQDNIREGSSSSDDAIDLQDSPEHGTVEISGKTEEVTIRKEAVVGDGVDQVGAERKLSLFKQEHFWDPNLGNDTFDEIDHAIDDHDNVTERRVAGDIYENSPYPEVSGTVRNYDIDVPCSTIRAWTIGLVLTTVAAGLNSLFSLRAPSITITSVVIQLVAYPIAQVWDLVMPNRQFNVFGVKFNLNPGPFNMKEHAIIVVMGNANFGGGAGYFLDTMTALKGFYGQDFGWGFGILLAITTQISGFGIAGILRKLLVEPASMMWPSQLVNVAFMYALHDHTATNPAKSNGWSIARYRWFLYVFAGAFIWYWFPGYIAPFLSVFAWVTFIRPNNVIINQLFGGWSGLSLIPITFDWTQITGYIFSPLIPPFHAIANTLIGVIFFFWIVTIGVHYSGIWYGEYLPICDSNSYDNTQSLYNVSKILTPEYTLDLEKYNNYSPLYLSTTFALTYGLSFASLVAVITHIGLFHGREIWLRLKDRSGQLDDVHTKLMKHYVRVPQWWYITLFVVMFGLSFAVIYGWPTHLPWWAMLIGYLIALVFTIPIGMVQAMTNIQLGLNVLTEFIIGYMVPGRPVGMMLFKTYGYISMSQALYFAQDLKLGHYLKIPQRPMFLAQVIATLWGSVVQVATFYWAFANIEGMCHETQANNFTCPNGRVFFNASVIWGLIGPKRIFSPGQLYSQLNWFWLVGFVLPVLIYIGARTFPRSNIRFLSAPIILGGSGDLPPATPLNYLSWGIVGFIFQKFIRNRYRGWWMRYNYITSAALDSGLAISTIVIILALSLTMTAMPTYWGTEVAGLGANGTGGTLDVLFAAVQKAPPADPGYFGPGPGQF